MQQSDLKEQLKEIKERIGEHDAQLNQIYDAMENLLDEKALQRKWNEREKLDLKNERFAKSPDFAGLWAKSLT